MATTNEEDGGKSSGIGEKVVRASISLRLIRHCESQNNQVYRDARRIFKGGSPDFDLNGWTDYVDERRSADPGLSDIGHIQSHKLTHFLEPHLTNQASRPVSFIVSPMRRTVETILPTLAALNRPPGTNDACQVLVHGLYFESEGCHTRETTEPGMSPGELTALFSPAGVDLSFAGFRDERGWYAHASSPETRAESEERAAQFYLWLVEFLEEKMRTASEEGAGDVFDAGVTLPGEEGEEHHDKFGERRRRRRTVVCIGHGDFMSLVLKRIVAGFGHSVEEEGVPHRSAFVHYNTGMTELEYFGNGRFLIMSSNQVPHLSGTDSQYITGGSLKDGWSYLMSENFLDAEVSIAYTDEIQPHVKEQTSAMRSLYLPREDSLGTEDARDTSNEVTIVVRRGMQVVGCASLDETTGLLRDVVVRPSARGENAGESLIGAAVEHARTLEVGAVVVRPEAGGREFFEGMGFKVVDGDGSSGVVLRMECRL